MPFDAADFELAPGFRPGERLLAGRPYVFDQDLLAAHLADRRLACVAADLSGLSDEEIISLWLAWLNRQGRTSFDVAVTALGARLCSERHRRGLDGGAER